jgi:hypothetical protein
MESTKFNNFFKIIFLFNFIIIKIDDYKIKYQSNIKLFVWGYHNFIKNKLK